MLCFKYLDYDPHYIDPYALRRLSNKVILQSFQDIFRTSHDDIWKSAHDFFFAKSHEELFINYCDAADFDHIFVRYIILKMLNKYKNVDRSHLQAQFRIEIAWSRYLQMRKDGFIDWQIIADSSGYCSAKSAQMSLYRKIKELQSGQAPQVEGVAPPCSPSTSSCLG